MAQYLFQNREYTEAITYYGRLREIISEMELKKKVHMLLLHTMKGFVIGS